MHASATLGGGRRRSSRLDPSRLDHVRRLSDCQRVQAGTRVGADGSAHVVLDGLDAGHVVRSDDHPLILRGDALVATLPQPRLDSLLTDGP